jgi:hypothetical protein
MSNVSAEGGQQTADPLSQVDQARGRRLAILSHPAGMTFWMVFTEHLPTLLLVSLGASEFLIGLQGAFLPGMQILQLPTLRRIAHYNKRSILIFGQVMSQIAGLPLLFLGPLIAWGREPTLVVVLASLALVAAAIQVGNTVWFPMLRSYVEPDRIGQFFGTIRSIWHLALIVYFLAARHWLDTNPGEFTPLFAVAWALGVVRVGLIARLPERSERTSEGIRVREAFALVRGDARLRRYLLGSTTTASVRTSAFPFAIVMMRREIGFSEAEILLTTLCIFGGGLISLYSWGRVADRIGPAPVFRICALSMAGLLLLPTLVDSAESSELLLMLIFFGGFSIFTSGFGVADTQVLFRMSPPDAPARTLVVCGVTSSVARGLVAIAVGVLLEFFLAGNDDPLQVYRIFFAMLAGVQALAFLPLMGFAREETT